MPIDFAHCAPTVAPYTMEQVVRVESGFQPLALNVNGIPADLQPRPRTTAEAVAAAHYWISKGHRVDLGPAQITDRNLPALHLTVEQVLGDDDIAICTNIAAGSVILTSSYDRAAQRVGPGQVALAKALSAYNTGNFTRGFENGYVAKFYSVPALTVTRPYAPRLTFVNRRSADIDVW